jgi:SAM-dependent methyltransferase
VRALTPEIMDGELPAAEAARALGDLDRVNRWLLGTRAVVMALRPLLLEGPRRQLLLDLGTGSGVTTDALRRHLARRGRELRVVGVDRRLAHLVAGRERGVPQLRVVASADVLPFRQGSVDWSVQSLLFHHFDGATNRRIVAEMRRVARRGAAVVDLVRSPWAGRLVRLLFPFLGIGRVAREDGELSVAQAWTPDEVRELLADDGIVEIRRVFPFRWRLVLGPS